MRNDNCLFSYGRMVCLRCLRSQGGVNLYVEGWGEVQGKNMYYVISQGKINSNCGY